MNDFNCSDRKFSVREIKRRIKTIRDTLITGNDSSTVRYSVIATDSLYRCLHACENLAYICRIFLEDRQEECIYDKYDESGNTRDCYISADYKDGILTVTFPLLYTKELNSGYISALLSKELENINVPFLIPPIACVCERSSTSKVMLSDNDNYQAHRIINCVCEYLGYSDRTENMIYISSVCPNPIGSYTKFSFFEIVNQSPDSIINILKR